LREGAIDPADEAAGAEPGADDLAPHGLKWTVAEASLEADGVSSRKASVKWRDYDLGDKRTPIDYFRHFYPVRHVPEMLEATNAVLAEKEKSPLTEQEFFVYVGLLLLMTFYPTFPVAVLFGVAGGVFSTRKFLALPKMQEYMSFYRFKLLGDNLTFATTPPADERARCAFWKVQPLVNAFNKNRKDGFVASFKVVADESMFEWRGRYQRHLRQGSLRLEARKTKRWQIRFFNCWLGICTVDAYLAYKRFCPGKDTVSQDDFVLDVIGELLDNTFGVAGGRVLRARPADDEPASSRVRRMHDMRQLMDTEHFTAKRAAHEENGRPTRSATLRCRICHTECCMYCLTCSPNPAKAKGIFAVCGPMTGRDCFLKHQQMSSQACAGAAGGSGGSGGNGSGGSGGR
jgi:uncharacterized membrane protein YgcG